MQARCSVGSKWKGFAELSAKKAWSACTPRNGDAAYAALMFATGMVRLACMQASIHESSHMGLGPWAINPCLAALGGHRCTPPPGPPPPLPRQRAQSAPPFIGQHRREQCPGGVLECDGSWSRGQYVFVTPRACTVHSLSTFTGTW